MAKKSKRAKLTKKLDDLCREAVRKRDWHTCQKCHKKVGGSNSQPCHVVAKGKGASLRRFDLMNIFLGCMHCHQQWHLNPLDSAAWFEKTFPARYAYLGIYRGGKPAPIKTAEMEQLVEKMKGEQK